MHNVGHSPYPPERPGSGRDPEDRPAVQQQPGTVRDTMLDKTLADSFPTSDPPSTIPDPSEDSFGEELAISGDRLPGDSEHIESPYDRRPHTTNKEAERQPLPVSNPFDRQPQPGQEPLPGHPDKAA